jgi:hypothetical protein
MIGCKSVIVSACYEIRNQAGSWNRRCKLVTYISNMEDERFHVENTVCLATLAC